MRGLKIWRCQGLSRFMEAVVEAGGSDSPRWFLVGVFVTHCNSVTGLWRLEAGG